MLVGLSYENFSYWWCWVHGHNVALYLRERGFDVVALDSLEGSTEFAVNRLRQYNISIIRIDVKSLNKIIRVNAF